jgi:hypothetical protein
MRKRSRRLRDILGLTSPPSDERSSLTVKCAIRATKRHKEGRRTSEGSWSVVSINTKDFPSLKRLPSKGDYSSRKLRCDFSAEAYGVLIPA